MTRLNKLKRFFKKLISSSAEVSKPALRIESNINGQAYSREFRNFILDQLREENVTRTEIAEEYNVSRMLIYRWESDEKKYGVGYKTPTEVLYERNIKIKNDDATGDYTAQQLADKYNLSEAQIRYIRHQVREGVI